MENNPYRLDGKLALVTGGGSGLGLAIAKEYLACGARVIITGTNEKKLEAAVRELGPNAYPQVSDVTALEALPWLAKYLEETYGPIDILVNNAGVHLKKEIHQVSDEEFKSVLETNLIGAFSLTREVTRYMLKRERGSVIMISSMAALYGLPKVSAYSASKAGIQGLAVAFASELSAHGIRFNSIAPGFIETDMSRKAFESDPERKQKVLGRTPLGRLGLPQDVGYAAVFLASDASRFITGVTLPVDGGNSIGF